MKQKLIPTILVLFTIGLLLLTGCGDSAHPESVNITIEMDEFSYLVHEFDLKDFKVGQEVTLTLVNVGVLEHEIMFGREMVAGGNGMPMGYEIDFFDHAGVEPILEVTEEVDHDDHGDEMVADEHAEEEEMHADDHGEEMVADEHEEEDMHADDHSEEEMDHDEAESDGHGHSGFMVTLAPGAEGYTIQFTITEEMIGEWEIGCFLLEGVHYTSGMYLEMKVSS